MTDLRQAALQALEALRSEYPAVRLYAVQALEKALVEPEQEMTKQKPVAWTDERGFIAYQANSFPHGTTVSPLYAHPPTPRKPLTDEELRECWDQVGNNETVWAMRVQFARAIERAHGIGDSNAT